MKVIINNKIIELSMVSSISKLEIYSDLRDHRDIFFAEHFDDYIQLATYHFSIKEIGNETPINVDGHMHIEKSKVEFSIKEPDNHIFRPRLRVQKNDYCLNEFGEWSKKETEKYNSLLRMWDDSIKVNDIPKLY